MRTIILSLLIAACSSRPNRACLLAENALKQAHKDGSCSPVSYGESYDYALWDFDDGEKLCHDMPVSDPKFGPLSCVGMRDTKAEIAAKAKVDAEAEAKAKVEAEAKAKVEAEAKARAELAGSGSGSGSAKGPK